MSDQGRGADSGVGTAGWGSQGPGSPGPRRLERSTSSKVVGGVAGGLAGYFGIDPIIVRIAFVVLAMGGPGVLLYLAAWALLPPDDGGEAAISNLRAPQPERVRQVLAGALVLFGALTLIGGFGLDRSGWDGFDGDFDLPGPWFWFPFELMIKVASLAAVIGGVIWLARLDRRPPTSASPVPPPPPGPPRPGGEPFTTDHPWSSPALRTDPVVGPVVAGGPQWLASGSPPSDLAPSDLAPSDLAPSDLAPSDLAPSDLAPSDLAPSD
ncbi:MAG: PspC domain-containing protein, partial [Acidimicrobiales bacterium]